MSVLLLPTFTLPKFKVLALEVSCPAETPVPDSAIVSEEFEAFELTVIPPLELPPAFGCEGDSERDALSFVQCHRQA